MNLKHALKVFLYFYLLSAISCQKNEVEPNCDSQINDLVLTEKQSFFLDLTFKEEFGQSSDRLRKWNVPISIFIEGSAPEETLKEIDKVITELSAMSTFIEITKVNTVTNSNFHVFLGTKEDYITLVEPLAAGIAEGNNGFATIAWNSDNEIIRASTCIDVLNTSFEEQKHIVREEMSQALGLINDTLLDDNSIFHQFFNDAINYSNKDKEMISYMLGNDLKAGMCVDEILNIIN